QVGAPLKSLLVCEIHRAGVLRQAGAGKNALKDAGRLLTKVILLEGTRENGIVAVEDWAKAEGRTYQAVGAAAGATRAQAGASSGCSGVRSDAAPAAARRIQDDARVHTEDVCARLSAQHVGVGDVEIVALDCDVEIVFQRQRDSVIQRQVELALVHELIDSRGVREIWLRHVPSGIRANRIRKMRDRLGVVQDRQGACFWRILRGRGWSRRRFLTPARESQ